MRVLSDLFKTFALDRERGLSSEAVASSRRQFGANHLTPLPREPLWKKFLEKFDEPIIKILLAAALLSMFVELFRGQPEDNIPGNPLAAGIALGIVALAAITLLV